MKKVDFTRHEGATRFRAEQLMKIAAGLDPSQVPEQGIEVKIEGEVVRLVPRDVAGQRYLMVA
jgi:hypothetical protein